MKIDAPYAGALPFAKVWVLDQNAEEKYGPIASKFTIYHSIRFEY